VPVDLVGIRLVGLNGESAGTTCDFPFIWEVISVPITWEAA
jgi:hypothetical protein